MSLDDIKKKLYQRDEDPDLGTHAASEFDPRFSKEELSQGTEGDLWAKKQSFNLKENKAVRVGLYSFLGILGVLAVILGAYYIKKSAFDAERVALVVSGPEQAASGKLLTYEIAYDNNNRTALKNVSLKMSYPENFRPEEDANFKEDGPVSGIYTIGDIPGHGKGKVVFNGRMYSPKGALIYLKADMLYSPGGVTSQFAAKNQLGINVTSTPLTVEILGPQNIPTGDEVNYLVTYRNTGEEDFSGVQLRMEYSDTFTYSGSDPKVSESNNIWYLGTVRKGQEGKIVATGKLEGNRDEIKKVKAYIGSQSAGNFISYSEEETETKIVSSPIAVSQKVNGLSSLNVNAGDTLLFEINFKNEGDIGLRDVLVKETLSSPVLDYASLDRGGGVFDEGNKTITWKASDTPVLKNLEPGMSGTIKFGVRVKDVIPVESGNDKNFVISSLAKVDSPDIPTPVSMNKIIAGNKMDMRLNSKLVLDAKGYYTDSVIPNSGPMPPKVNEETTYTMHWSVINVSNDITAARVEAVLPTGSTMTEKIFPEGARLAYNERNNSVVWEIGNIEAGSGILSAKKEVAFQVKIKPSPDQVGRVVELLGESKITASDSFTGEALSSGAEKKNTGLREDPTADAGDRVVP